MASTSTLGERTDDSSSSLKRVAGLIKTGKAKKIIVMTGAGISTSAGIPDFRSPTTGLYANLKNLNLPFPEAVFELNYFKKFPKPFWTLAKELYPGKHFPTPTHYFLTLLQNHSYLLRIFSQNIDTLDTLAGLDPEYIAEAHGSFATSHCLGCGIEISSLWVLKSGVRKGEVVNCMRCGGLVKPDIVFYGEGLPERFFRLLEDFKKCDLLIVIGTSLQVYPFASLIQYVSATTPRILINREPAGPFRHRTARDGFKDGKSQLILDKRKGESDELDDSESSHSIDGEEDESTDRDMYYHGDADDAIWQLVDELGWRDLLEETVRSGNERLRERWRVMEGDDAESVEVGEEVTEEVEKVSLDNVEKVQGCKETKNKGQDEVHEEGGNLSTKEEEKQEEEEKEDDVEGLQRAIEKQLNM